MSSLAASLAAFLAALALLVQTTCNPALPPLAASRPAANATNVARTTWIELDFTAPIPNYVAFRLSCDAGQTFRAVTMHHVTPEKVVLNPKLDLPAGQNCLVGWRTESGPAAIGFTTAAAGPVVRVVVDRTDPGRTSPIPDDYFLTPDATKVTGQRLNFPIPARTNDVVRVFTALLTEGNQLDGWSPIAHMVVEFSSPIDASTLPKTPQESLSPVGAVALIDVDPASPTFGDRVPFKLQMRNNDTTPQNRTSHTFLLFPAVPLEPEGRYGLVVSRRVLASPGSPVDPSVFFAAALAPAAAGENAAITRTRALAQDVLAVAGSELTVPIPVEDVAYVARISIRSTDGIQDDVQVMKRQILAEPPPAVTIDLGNPQSVVTDSNPNVAAYVRGTWDAPEWRGPDGGVSFVRDAQGRPVRTGSKPVCFRLALPAAARNGPVPIVIYQHGNPGESETEVRNNARNFLAQAGYAVIGFTDILNREVAPPDVTPGVDCINYENPTDTDEGRITNQVFGIVASLLADRRISDHWNETLGEQLAFTRAVQGLADLDLLPLGSPDGVPDLDTSRILYHGISEGGNNGQAFVPYSPEVRAAAVMVGGARLMEVLIHQQANVFMTTLPTLFPQLRPDDIWTATSFFQSDFDRQDKHNHGRFAYRERAEVPLFCDDLASCLDADWCDDPSHCTDQKPSTLLVEGIDDSLVPNATTESAAFQLGPIPHLAPVQRAVPFLDVVTDEVSGNVDAETTAAFFQFVPVGVPGIAPTPGCSVLDPSRANEGHYCAQSATESRAQRLIFFGTAVDPTRDAPTIVNPFLYYPPGRPLFPLPNPLP
jgi:methionine-rich copper-binding protein CopC